MATHLIYILEVPGSNLVQDVEYLDRSFFLFGGVGLNPH
jgi:hypothetical protein